MISANQRMGTSVPEKLRMKREYTIFLTKKGSAKFKGGKGASLRK